MLNVTIHLGSATPFSSRAGPRAPACHERLSAPAPLSLPLGPTRLHLARPGHGRVAARRSGPGPTTAPAPRGTPTAGPPLSSLFSLTATPLVHSLVTDPTPPPSRAPPPSPPFPRPYRCLRPPEASPSPQILPSAAAVFPLSSERSLSFAIPKLELNLSSPFHTGAAGPHTRRHRPSELPPHRRTPLSRARLPPPRRPVIRVCATPARVARRHPEESLVLSGCTSPPSGRRQTRHRAARPRPSQLVGRPRVAGRHALWAVTRGRFWPSTMPGI
jgi:hypothetical protein